MSGTKRLKPLRDHVIYVTAEPNVRPDVFDIVPELKAPDFAQGLRATIDARCGANTRPVIPRLNNEGAEVEAIRAFALTALHSWVDSLGIRFLPLPRRRSRFCKADSGADVKTS